MFAKISSMVKKIDAAIDLIIENISKLFITPEAARRKPDQNPKPKAKFTHEMGMSYF